MKKAIWTFAAATAIGLAASLPASAETVSDLDPLVSVDWLAANADADNLVILDLRAATSEKEGQSSYATGHVPGAVSAPYPQIWRAKRDGVAGVLPELDVIDANVESLGISNDTAVVIVPAADDASEFGAAARVYWTLSYLGLDEVAILDGGLKAWTAADKPLSTEAVTPVAADFEPNVREELLASTADMEQEIGSGRSTLLDARPLEQFIGKAKHQLALAAGRLPGSVNLDQSQFYNADANRLKSIDQLESLVSDKVEIGSDERVVSYCNTGHWAATNWFVLHEVLGHDNTTLYDESMVGWTQKSDRPLDVN